MGEERVQKYQSYEVKLATGRLEKGEQLETASLALSSLLYHIVFDFLRQFGNHLIYTPHALLSLLLLRIHTLTKGLGLLPHLLMQHLQFLLHLAQSLLDSYSQLGQILAESSLKTVEDFNPGFLYASQFLRELLILPFHNGNQAIFHILPLLNNKGGTLHSLATKLCSLFCRSLSSAALFRLESSHFFINYPSRIFISAKLSLSSRTLPYIDLISSAHRNSASSTRLVSSSSVWSLAIFCLWTVMASNFCSIFSNLSRLSLRASEVALLLLPSSFEPNPLIIISILFIFKLQQSEITAMIYMRDRHSNKKKPENKEDNTARNYLDQLKSKFAKKSTPAARDAGNKPENTRNENQPKPLLSNQKSQKYAISHSKPNEHAVSDSKFSQSIIVHEGPYNPNPLFSKRPALTTVKCFDIQIVNDLSSSRFRAQAYIQILEREKQLKNREITALKELIAAEREKSPLKEEVEQLKKAAGEKTKEIERYGRFFKEGKELFLNAAMELIDSRNELSTTLTKQRIKTKERSLSRCIERIQRLMSIYSNLVELSGKAPSEGTTVDQLWTSVKYQQKIIELMKQNETNQKVKDYHHENTLLRYEINRLSKHNQQLLKLIANQEDSLQLDYSRSYQPNIPPNRPQESIILHEHESDQIQEDSHEESSLSEPAQQTPFQQLKDHFSQSIQHPFSNLELQTLTEAKTKLEKELSDCKKELADCQKDLSERKTRVNILQVEKEYIQDQLQQVEKSERDLKQELKTLMEENEQLRDTIRGLKVKPPLVQDEYEMAMESEKAMGEQNDLLRDRINFLLKPNGKDTVTVEELLKLLKRKELAHYHQALMELISKYEQRISELTNSYIYERELKQHSLTYCKGLFNIVQATSRTQNAPTLEDIIDYINKYQDIMAELRENQIDVYLRKIRSLSIGIDESAAETIKEELKDYVYQLQTRLPTLSEEYLEDGSSIADSYHNSVERFD